MEQPLTQRPAVAAALRELAQGDSALLRAETRNPSAGGDRRSMILRAGPSTPGSDSGTEWRPSSCHRVVVTCLDSTSLSMSLPDWRPLELGALLPRTIAAFLRAWHALFISQDG